MPHHIIHKQTVNLLLPDAASSVALQDQVSHMLRHEVNDAMEAVFDSVSGNGEVIRINRLELDLGTISQHNFNEEFKNRIIEELKKALPEIKNAATTSSENALLSYRESVMESLRYFLSHGRLPWYAGTKQMKEWEEEICSKFTDKEWHELIEWLQEQHPQNPFIADRLVMQFSDHFIYELVKYMVIPAYSNEPIERIYNDLNVCIHPFSVAGTEKIRFLIWKNLFGIIYLKQNKVTASETQLAIQSIIQELGIKEQLIASLKKKDWEKAIKTDTIRQTMNIIKLNNENVRKSVNDSQNSTRSGSDLPEGASQIKLPENNSETDQAMEEDDSNNPNATEKGRKYPEKKKDKKRPASKIPVAEDSFFLQNCGIVLLNPFLKNYFQELGLLDGTVFKDTDSHHRAVLLLHYLATGSPEAAEFDLTLQKIMCGLPTGEPVPNSIELTEKEKEESENLLHAVTQHWKPLNNTSVEGLRTTFLQREGKLKIIDNGWKLYIEPKTVDILIGKLPWGFSTIRLPWMENILHVEWY